MLIRTQADPDPREDDEDETGGVAPPNDDNDKGGEAAEVEEEPEVVEEDEPELEEEPVRAPPKGKTRDENFAEMRRRQAALEAENEQLRRSQQQARPQQEQETPQAREQRLARLTPQQRDAYEAAEREERLTRVGSLAEFRVAEMTDKAAFRMLSQSDPRASKYASEVETRLNQMRSQGMNASREDVLRYIIGEKVMANGPKAKKQIAAAKAEVDRQTTKPEKPKGDRGGNRPKDDKAARKQRLAGVIL